MQIDKLFDEFCSLIQEQKKIFNEMNCCATQTFDARRCSELIDKYNAVTRKCAEAHKRLITMRDKNIESMCLSLKQHYGITDIFEHTVDKILKQELEKYTNNEH